MRETIVLNGREIEVVDDPNAKMPMFIDRGVLSRAALIVGYAPPRESLADYIKRQADIVRSGRDRSAE